MLIIPYRWFTTEIINRVIQCDFFSHICLFCVHYNDWRSGTDFVAATGTYVFDDVVVSSAALLNSSNKKFVWSRTLFPWYNLNEASAGGIDFAHDDIYASSFYKTEFDRLESEKQLYGADFSLVDFEPYGIVYVRDAEYSGGRTDVCKAKAGFANPSWTDAQVTNVENAISSAQTTQPDFAMPAAYGINGTTNHFYNAARTAEIANCIITEHTYNWSDAGITYNYCMPAFYLDDATLTPSEICQHIFDANSVWSSKGLLLWLSSSALDPLGIINAIESQYQDMLVVDATEIII